MTIRKIHNKSIPNPISRHVEPDTGAISSGSPWQEFIRKLNITKERSDTESEPEVTTRFDRSEEPGWEFVESTREFRSHQIKLDDAGNETWEEIVVSNEPNMRGR